MRQLFIFFFAITLQAHAQTVIDYGAWAGTTACNAFATNTTINGIVHLSTVGQPKWDNTNKAVVLDGSLSAGAPLGTEYRIAYSFKQNYSYSITVSTVASVGSGTYYPYLRLRMVASTGNSTLCNGPQTIDQNITGTLTKSNTVDNNGNNTFQDKGFDFISIGSANPYLTISNIPNTLGSAIQTIYIKKITIREIAPATPAFTVSPTSVNKICGTALTKTFTINNVNNTVGITKYVWDLGGDANGWTYNNAPAPQIIETTTNTLTLTGPACVSYLNYISASAVVSGTNYAAGRSMVDLTMPSMTMSITDPLCTSGSFSLSGVPSCSNPVSWTSSNTSVATILSTGNPVTATKVNAGTVTITASVSGCGLVRNVSKTIKVGGYSSGEYNISGPSTICAGSTGTFTVNSLPGATGYTWFWPGGFTVYNGGNGYSYLTLKPLSSGSAGQVGVRVANACDGGGSPSVITVTSVSCARAALTALPNPTTDNVTLAMAQSTGEDHVKSKGGIIRAIKVLDPSGNVVKQLTYIAGVSRATISLGGLKRGIYTVQVFDGALWSSLQVVRQ